MSFAKRKSVMSTYTFVLNMKSQTMLSLFFAEFAPTLKYTIYNSTQKLSLLRPGVIMTKAKKSGTVPLESLRKLTHMPTKSTSNLLWFCFMRLFEDFDSLSRSGPINVATKHLGLKAERMESCNRKHTVFFSFIHKRPYPAGLTTHFLCVFIC